MTTESRCIVCGGQLTLFGPFGDYKYYLCRGCGSIQLSPMPDAQTMQRAYEEEYAHGKQLERYFDPEWARAAVRPYNESVAKAARDHVNGGLAIECGAGWGGLVEMLMRDGFEVQGVELSTDQVAFGQRRGWPIRQGDLNALSEFEGRADVVTMCAVFEHLTDHGEVIDAAHRLLKDGGKLITLHPTAKFYAMLGAVLQIGNRQRQLPSVFGAFAAPWHTMFPSISATKRMVSPRGFRLIEIRPAPQGTHGGINGLAQRVLGMVNVVGFKLLKLRWPLITSHVFVFEKVSPTSNIAPPQRQ
jgi:SAM-dependent methyltransferase